MNLLTALVDLIALSIVLSGTIFLVRRWLRIAEVMKAMSESIGQQYRGALEVEAQALTLLQELNAMAETLLALNRELGTTLTPPPGFTAQARNLPLLGRHAAHDNSAQNNGSRLVDGPVYDAIPVDPNETPDVDESALCGPCQCDEMQWGLHCHYHRSPYSVMWGCDATRKEQVHR